MGRIATGFTLLLLAGCATAPVPVRRIDRMIAVLKPTEGNEVRGTVAFTRADDGVRIVVDLTGLSPGLHAFHIHEFGDCCAPDAASAGGHFNPEGQPHGGPDAAERHAGDLGNIVADETGHAQLDRTDSGITLDGDESILGRSVIVHAGPDDFWTQPTGNAGARVACGVIGLARPGD